jgi:hypothetical protein
MIMSKKLDYSKIFSLVLGQVVRLGSARIKVADNESLSAMRKASFTKSI